MGVCAECVRPVCGRPNSERLLALLERYPKSSLWMNLQRFMGWTYVMQLTWRLFSSATLFIAPLALRQLVLQVGTRRPFWFGCGRVAAFGSRLSAWTVRLDLNLPKKQESLSDRGK
jgi:hypothetical protein